MVSPGDKAPDFTLPDEEGKPFHLYDHRGKIIVLYFYPRAMTPGCTREAIRFNELYYEFMRHNAIIVGVSTDSVKAIRRFIEKYGLKFKLLSDPEARVVELYGVLKKGGKRPSAQRVTFIIDRDLRVVEVLRNIRPAERHADEALRVVEKISRSI